MNNLSSLLNRAAILLERNKAVIAEARHRGEEFNVFHLCKVDHYENCHSAILAEFLDPNGSHGQGDTFLRLFLDAVDKDFALRFNSRMAVVTTEYSIDLGRLDILIEDKAGKAVIIENKIYAADQDAQLQRYEMFAKKNYGENNYRLLYLSLDGREAGEKSGQGVSYEVISYGDTILKWLQSCIEAAVSMPFLRESFIQYRRLVEQLTERYMDKTVQKELLAEMSRFPEGAAAIFKAYPEWERSVIMENLITPLETYAKEKGLGFNVNNKFWSKSAWGRIEFPVMHGLTIVIECEYSGWRGFYYGITDLREPRREKRVLPGLEGGNDDWRYGWHYLDLHRDWMPEDVAEIANDGGRFLHYLTDAVDMLMKEMGNNEIK
ncbi:MAG: PD-(D/E)XK nuclease family protein [Bacteroidales bacterium]|nr:PD-(D/E)XK nuclease family protein [Bacteroidales bacterium]